MQMQKSMTEMNSEEISRFLSAKHFSEERFSMAEFGALCTEGNQAKLDRYLSCFPVQGGATPSQWQKRKLTTVPYLPNQKQVIDLRKYETDGVFDRIIVRVTGTVNTGSATAGTATGNDNPEGLLQNCTMVVTPSPQGLVPFNQVSGRTLRIDRGMEDMTMVRSAVVNDDAGAVTLDIEYHLIFQRRFLKRGIEYAFDIGRYTGAVLNLTFADQTALFTGSSNTWNWSAANVEIWGIINYNVQPQHLHAVELFENLYPVVATNSAFLIDNLPNGSYYGDIVILSEFDNALDNRPLGASSASGIPTGSFDLSSGSRSWLQLGDNNADFIQRDTRRLYDGSVFNIDDPGHATAGMDSTVVGQFALARLGKQQALLTKAPEALTSQLLIKVSETVTSGHTSMLRLFGRKIVPGGVYTAPAKGQQ